MSVSLRDLGKRVRRGIKEPVQSAMAWAAVQQLDTHPRTLEEVRALEPRSIVVSRTDRIGDLLVSSVMIAALRRKWPGARLCLIAGARNASVAQALGVEAGPVFGGTPASWARLSRWLPDQRFELAMSLQAESMSGAMVAAWSGAPVRIATHDTKMSPAFNFVFGLDDRHHVTRFCKAAALLGAPCPDSRPQYEVSPRARDATAEVVRAWTGRLVVGIQVPNRTSARHRARAWPEDRIVALARALGARGRLVMLFGFGPELAEAARISAAVPGIQVAPALPLSHTAALLEHVDVFVSGYTGTYHLADAVGARTVLIGSAHYADYWRALGDGHRYALAESAAGVGVDAVDGAVEELLAQAGRRA